MSANTRDSAQQFGKAPPIQQIHSQTVSLRAPRQAYPGLVSHQGARPDFPQPEKPHTYTFQHQNFGNGPELFGAAGSPIMKEHHDDRNIDRQSDDAQRMMQEAQFYQHEFLERRREEERELRAQEGAHYEAPASRRESRPRAAEARSSDSANRAYVQRAMMMAQKLGLAHNNGQPAEADRKLDDHEQFHSANFRDEAAHSAKETLTLSGTLSGLNAINGSSKNLHTHEDRALQPSQYQPREHPSQPQQIHGFYGQNRGESQNESYAEENDDGQFSDSSQERGQPSHRDFAYQQNFDQQRPGQYAEYDNQEYGNEDYANTSSELSSEHRGAQNVQRDSRREQLTQGQYRQHEMQARNGDESHLHE